jgi:hypothetical protein
MYSISKNDIMTFYNGNTVESYANKNVIEGFDEYKSSNLNWIITALIIFLLLAGCGAWWYFYKNNKSQQFGFRFY